MAMNNIISKCFTLLVFVTVFLGIFAIPTVFAQDKKLETTTSLFIEPKIEETNERGFNLYLGTFVIEASDRLTKEQLNDLASDPSATGENVVPVLAGLKLLTGKEEIINPTVKLKYFQASTSSYVDVPGCEQVLLADSNGDKVYENYCRISDKTIYENKCTGFKAVFIPVENENPKVTGAVAYGQLCDDKVGSIDTFTAEVKNLFNVNPSNTNYWLYVGFATLLGLLLASLYFAGKNAISLLDITQPRLPGPKALTASGQILGPFGYTEMKSTTMKKLKTTAEALSTWIKSQENSRNISVLNSRRVNGYIDTMSLSAGDKSIQGEVNRSKTFARSVGLLYSKTGADITRIQSLLTKHINAYTPEDHASLRRVLNDITKSNKANAHDRLAARMLSDYYLGVVQYQQLEVLTAHAKPGQRANWLQLAQSGLAKTVGSGRYSVLGYWVPGILDSSVRSARVVGKYALATPAVITATALDIVKGGKGRDYLKTKYESYEKLGKKPTFWEAPGAWLAHGLYGQLQKHSAEEIIIGGKTPVLDKMAYHYKMLEKTAYRNLMEHVVGEIYEQNGITLNLSKIIPHDKEKILHEMLLIDILEKTNANALASRVAALEKEMRDILRNAGLSDAKKLGELMTLAAGRGVHLEERFHNALASLNTINGKAMYDHTRLLALQNHIEEYQTPVHEGGFAYTFGKKLNDQEQFRAITIGRLIHNLQEVDPHGNPMHSGAPGIREALAAAFVDVANKVYTIAPLMNSMARDLKLGELQHDERGMIVPNKNNERIADGISKQFFGGKTVDGKEIIAVSGKDLIAIQNRSLQYLKEVLLTGEGRAQFNHIIQEYARRNIKGAANIESANMGDMFNVLYGFKAILAKYSEEGKTTLKRGGEKEDNISIRLFKDYDGKKLYQWFEEDREIGPEANVWKLDMKRVWLNLSDKLSADRDNLCAAQWSASRIYRGNTVFHDPDIEKELNDREAKIKAGGARIWHIDERAIIGDKRSRSPAILSEDEIKLLEKEAKVKSVGDAKIWTIDPHTVDSLGFSEHSRRALESSARIWTPLERSIEVTKSLRTKLIGDNIHTLLNSINPGAYGSESLANVRNLSQWSAAFLSDALRKRYGDDLKDTSKWLLKTYDPTNREHRETLTNLLDAHHDVLDAYMKKGVSYADVRKQAWVMLYEGGFVPHSKGAMVSDKDRVLGGYISLRDEQGRPRRFDAEHVRIDFNPKIKELEVEREHLLSLQKSGKISLHEQSRLTDIESSIAQGTTLQKEFNRVANRNNKEEWKEFIHDTRRWANEHGSEGDRVFEAILWRYRNNTSDWAGYSHLSKIEVLSKREVAPLAPQFQRFFAQKDTDILLNVRTKVRNAFLTAGDVLSQISLVSAGQLVESSYAITPFSEYYKQNSMRLSMDIMRMKNTDWDSLLADVPDEQERKKLRGVYESVALSHGAYHQVWDYAIDRNPWRHSTSYGAHQTWGGFFQFGPVAQYTVKQNLSSLLSPNEYRIFNAQYGWQMTLARTVFMPFALMARGFQMSIQGYPSRWDINPQNLLKPHNYTPTRFMEAFRSFNPFAAYAQTANFPSWVPFIGGKKLRAAEPWGSNLERTQLGGRAFAAGLYQNLYDIPDRSGVFSSARLGGVNPGASIYDDRFFLHLDAPMAEYLAYRSGEMSEFARSEMQRKGKPVFDPTSFFKEDEYVKAQAMRNTIKREVASEAKLMTSEQELRGFGPLSNPIWSWFNPYFFAWHSGFGIAPMFPQFSPKEFVTSAMARRGSNDPLVNWSAIKEKLSGTGHDALRLVKPWRNVDVAYCGSCSTAGYRLTYCRKCNEALYTVQ